MPNLIIMNKHLKFNLQITSIRIRPDININHTFSCLNLEKSNYEIRKLEAFTR